jgi:hypothetical protein
MDSLLAPIGLAVIAFASTNVDDVFVLVAFLPISTSVRVTLLSANIWV